MQTLEYKTVDKSTWGEGEWQNEPDKKQWQDEETGYPCLIVRNKIGALCGYVGVPKGHPFFEVEGYDLDVNMHWGITFTGFCQHGSDPQKGICHIDPDNDNVWWLGFDTAHSGDICPSYSDDFKKTMKGFGYEYRNFDYVTKEVQSLALQLKQIERAAA